MAPTHSHYPGAADEVAGLPVHRSTLTPLAFLERTLAVYPEKVAVVDGARRLTYRELGERVYRLASALRRVGVRKGDRVAVLSPNSTELLEAHFGVPQIGAVLVAINVRLSPGEVSAILRHSGARVLLVDHALAADLDRRRDRALSPGLHGDGAATASPGGARSATSASSRSARRSRSRRTWTTRTRRSASTTRVARRASRRASCTRTAAHT